MNINSFICPNVDSRARFLKISREPVEAPRKRRELFVGTGGRQLSGLLEDVGWKRVAELPVLRRVVRPLPPQAGILVFQFGYSPVPRLAGRLVSSMIRF